MKRVFRILLALAAFAGIVAVGMSGTAWADKLKLGGQVPAARITDGDPAIGSRPAGTIITNPHIFILNPHIQGTVGSCTTVLMGTGKEGVTYTATVVSSDYLPSKLPGSLISCVVRIDAVPLGKPGAGLGTEVKICFPIPPTKAGFAYYTGNPLWVKTTLDAKDGQSCVVVPATATNPIFSALFDK